MSFAANGKLYIVCDGGFANRINSLLPGLFLANLINYQPVICWPVNRWCGLKLCSALSVPSELLVSSLELHQIVASIDTLTLLTHNVDLPNLGPRQRRYVQHLHDSDLSFVTSLLTRTRSSLYYHDSFPAWIDLPLILSQINRFRFQPQIYSAAFRFLLSSSLLIDQAFARYTALHLRATDFASNAPDPYHWYDYVRSYPSEKFFVCSDDLTVESLFNKLPNAFVRVKRSYARKSVVDRDWRHFVFDPATDRWSPFNIERDGSSVFEALVDLVLLSSASNSIETSASSFLRLSSLLGRSQLNPRINPALFKNLSRY